MGDNFWTTEYNEFCVETRSFVKVGEDEVYIILEATLNDYHGNEEDYVPIAVSREDYVTAINEYLRCKMMYYNSYESEELGVGYIEWASDNDSFITAEADNGHFFDIPIVTFEDIQMERG